MNSVIDTAVWGIYRGFTLAAELTPDFDNYPTTTGYTDEQIAAWKRDDWSFVAVTVYCSKAGIRLGETYLHGCEYGAVPGDDRWVTPIEKTEKLEDWINGYGMDLADEAVAEAEVKLTELCAGCHT